MTVIYRPCYATRSEVKRATDINNPASMNAQVDRAIVSASNALDSLCHRHFYPEDTVKFYDWPNFQRSYPWRLWFDAAELADITTNPPVVTTGGTVIPDSAIFFGSPTYNEAPYTYLELDRSQSYAFGVGPTPQRDISITGTFGYWVRTSPGGTLAASVSSTTSTSITVSNGVSVSPGDTITIDRERMVVQDQSFTSTAISFSGALTASTADNIIYVPDETQFSVGEELRLDSEYLLLTDTASGQLIIQRGFDGSVLAAHTSGTIYAARSLTVARGALGTVAATHSNGAAISVHAIPGEVKSLAIAEALNTVFQETSGYARSIGEQATPVPGGSLPDLRKRVYAHYGRKGRTRVV